MTANDGKITSQKNWLTGEDVSFQYDLSNRLSSVAQPDGNESYVYAPDNRRVWRNAGRTASRAGRGSNQEYFWSGYGPGEVA